MATGKFIAYYRVSTDRQGQSGLGLEAQRTAVSAYLNGGDWDLLNEFTEVETGKGSNALAKRPQLNAAIKACRQQGATLVIAKLDRLARNVHFVSGLMESRVDFVAADNPHANKTMIQMLAVFAEHERDQISIRTKAALAAAKARGVKLGVNGKALARQNKEAANQFAASIANQVQAIRADGYTTVTAITEQLNERKVPTARGGKWHFPSTQRLLKRLGA